MTPEQIIPLTLVLPLVGCVLCFAFGKAENLREASTLIVSTVLFGFVCNLATHVFAGARPQWSLGTMVPGFDIAFEVEPLGMLFALVASGLWIATTVYAIGYMRGHNEQNQTRFFACFALAIFAALSAAFSANLFTLFVAYEVMTVSTYPLVTHHGTEAARRGGRTYLGILLSTSIAFFMLAIVWTWSVAGSVDFTQGGLLSSALESAKISRGQLFVLLGLFAFGIGKAALMPFHRWLPAAMVAPTPVSALLHAVAVVKVGVFSLLKVAVYIFGIDLLRETGVSTWLAYLAGASLLIASLVAMQQDNLKKRLAYSTISQLAYITLGAALATPAAAIGAGMHIVMHAVGKITLFFCAGAIYVGAHKTEISTMRGLGRTMPFTFGAFLLATLSIIGLPPGGGSWSKWLLAVGTVETQNLPLTAALMISSLLNIWYLVVIPIQAFRKPDAPADGTPTEGDHVAQGDQTHRSGIHEAPLMCVVPLCITAVGSVALFFAGDWIYEVLKPIVSQQS